MNKVAVETRRIFRKSVWQMNPDGMVLVPQECDSFEYKGPVAEAAAYLYSPPFGVPGDLSRPNAPYVAETQILNPSLPFSNYGLPGKIAGGLFVPVAANNDVVYGFLIRVFPGQGANASDPIGTAVPIATGPANVMRKGYMNVFCQLGTPSFGAAVYIRYQNAVTGQIVGGLESGTTGNNYALTGATWMGPPDSSGNAEISFGNTGI